MTDWNALERAGEDRLVANITEAWSRVARNHKQTFRMLALHPPVEHIMAGHPDDHPANADDTDTPPIHDPTGETAIANNEPIRRQEIYSQFLAEVEARVAILDSICRQMMPATAPPPTTDDHWCKNCITAQVCSPRKDRYHYCRWCISIRQAYGALPPVDIIRLHESGDSVQVAKALDAWAKRRS